MTERHHFRYCATVLAWLSLSTFAYSAGEQSKDLAKLQQKIEELDRAGKYREGIPTPKGN